MSDTTTLVRLKDLWDERHAEQLSGNQLALLRYRSNLLGAVLTFAPRPLYPAQTGTGSRALTEQQLAGLLMWVPAALVSLGLCVVLVLLWLRRLERDSPSEVPMPPPSVPDAAGVLGSAGERGRR